MIQNETHFDIFLRWLTDLGGTYKIWRNLEEPKPVTGRRNPDTQPRQYVLNPKKYFVDFRGIIRRH